MSIYFRYWGKTDKLSLNYHLLPYHCLDVAAVVWVLLDPEKPLCRHLADQLGIAPKLLQRLATFFLSLHDTGKFATAFQGLVTGLSPLLVQPIPKMKYLERHDSLGYRVWDDNNFFQNLVDSGCFSWIDSTATSTVLVRRAFDVWMKIVTGHHGIPPKESSLNLSNFFTADDEAAALEYTIAIAGLFASGQDWAFLEDKAFCKRLKMASWPLAGLVVLADWLGSSRDPQQYLPHEMPLHDYWNDYALPFAEQVVARSQISPTMVAPYVDTIALFPFVHTLTPLQRWAEECELPQRNQIFILEDVTGAGKTEAAVTLAHRLMACGLADGIYVALPTMATANAMYGRMGKVYRRLFAGNAFPSLVLAHGARHLSEAFRNSVSIALHPESPQRYGEEDTAEAICCAWLADSQKKSLLADVGVGTVDQALLAVLPARHQSLRCLGLARKVLIVDEVHAYDPYMNRLLQSLLEYHASQGGSAILLSATLPYAMRAKYLQSFCEGADCEGPPLERSQLYPMATHFPAIGRIETMLDTRREVERTLSVVLLERVDRVLDIIRNAIELGKCVCWVRNTVGDSIKAYRQLSKQDWMQNDKLSLFHSRFAMIDRQRIESATLGHFGKHSSAEVRRSRVLVATQVVEQSLDLDFDLIVSDLTFIDLLIQRAGREHRHVRDEEGNVRCVEGAVDLREAPVFYVLGPPATDAPAADWLKSVLPGTQAVYQHVGQLWLTHRLLAEKGEIKMPGDARRLIEGVYSEEAQEKIPTTLLPLTWKALGDAGGKLSMANLNVLKFAKGYSSSSSQGGGWEEESRIPTRLGDDSIRIVLAVPTEGGWRAYAECEEFSWELSMLSVPKRRWEEARALIPAKTQGALVALRDEVRALQWIEVFPLIPELADWYDDAMGWGLYKESADESD